MAAPKQGLNIPNVKAQAQVSLWDRPAGRMTEYVNGRLGFTYDPEYLKAGPSLSPKHLPLEDRVFEFPSLRNYEAFQGLPGVLADSLPDTFGNLIIRNYFQSRGEPDKAMSPVQRLLYVGSRAMGALEYAPALQKKTADEEQALEIQALVESARKLLEGDASEVVQEIMKVGGSAGGARPKALILWNQEKNRVRSGFARPETGDESWIIKFDGVGSANKADFFAKPYNRVEYTYSLIAHALGIDMFEVQYLEEQNGLFHFLTRRFDRAGDRKIHMHSLGGITHVDFNMPQTYSYEAWFRLIQELQLGYPQLEQAYRRMLFNVVGRNQDDHVKNIAFLMDNEASGWRLAPAFDLTYAAGLGYTAHHQMTIGGLADGFTRTQLIHIGKQFDIRKPEVILDNTLEAFSKWPSLAHERGIDEARIEEISKNHRFYLAER